MEYSETDPSPWNPPASLSASFRAGPFRDYPLFSLSSSKNFLSWPNAFVLSFSRPNLRDRRLRCSVEQLGFFCFATLLCGDLAVILDLMRRLALPNTDNPPTPPIEKGNFVLDANNRLFLLNGENDGQPVVLLRVGFFVGSCDVFLNEAT